MFIIVIEIYSKYAWVVPLKNKKGITTTVFQNFFNESSSKPDKIQVDEGSEFYNISIESWLQGNDIEMYSTHNEGKFVVAGRLFRTSKNKVYKYMISIPKNVYIDKLTDIVNEHNNTYHSIVKMENVDVKSSSYIDFAVKNNGKDPTFKVSEHIRILKYKNIFAKGLYSNLVRSFCD